MNIDAAISQEAIRWWVRLASADASAADHRACERWLMLDERHREAFDAVANDWKDLDGLDAWAHAELVALEAEGDRAGRRLRTFRIAGLAAAAVVALAVVLTVVYRSPAPLVYETARAEQRHVVLEDGSRMYLNTSTSLHVNFDPTVREVVLASGEGFFDVEHDGLRPFVVRAGHTSVIAVGTRFAVRRLPGDNVEVTVLEGRVAVVPADAAPPSGGDARRSTRHTATDPASGVIVEQNQQARLAPEGDLRSLTEVEAAVETAWMEGKLIFDGTPLREVVAEMSRYVPEEIRVADDVPDHPVTGIIKIRNPDRMLDLLSQVVPVTPVKESATVTVLHTRS